MDKTNNSIKSLDEDDAKTYMYLKHKQNEKTWKINAKHTHHSEFLNACMIDKKPDTYGFQENNPIVLDVKEHTIPFIIKYMEYFGEGIESLAPEPPLKDIHISNILGDEYVLYADIFGEDDALKDKLLKTYSYTEAALYFQLKYLPKKLCAIMADLTKKPDIRELEAMAASFTAPDSQKEQASHETI
jgi:hypothetical protein